MRKFAIYKAETGYYYLDYYDSLEALADTKFANIINEDQLPVVLDGKGGYYRFTKNEYGFVKIIETEDEIPLSLEQMFFKNDEKFKLGWISPEGDTYSCDFTGHSKAAVMIARKFIPNAKYPERALGKAGWLKVIDSWNGTERKHGQYVYSLSGKITGRQADKLYDLGLYNNEEVMEMIKRHESGI